MASGCSLCIRIETLPTNTREHTHCWIDFICSALTSLNATSLKVPLLSNFGQSRMKADKVDAAIA